MRPGLIVAGWAAVFGFFTPPEASAQIWVWSGPPAAYPTVPIFPAPPTVLPSYGAPRVTAAGLYSPVYDYFGAPYPLPARLYSGYGSNDFPYYGRAYGHAYEPWTWEGMGRYPAYPPLRVNGVIPAW